MFGIFIIILLVSFSAFVITAYFEKSNEDPSNAVIGAIVTIVIIAITLLVSLITYFTEKQKVQEIIAYKALIENSRIVESSEGMSMTALERFKLMEGATKYNKSIAAWKTYGNDWYASEWLYPDTTKEVEYIK
jgi:hypothetical protein